MSAPDHAQPRCGLLSRLARCGVAGLALALSLSGCAELEEEKPETYQPAQLKAVGPKLKQVTFTSLAAEQVDLTTKKASREGRYTVVDYAALIYDGQGVPWVYTVREPLTFLRSQVSVDRIEGQRVLISRGLTPGTEVVTTGAAEVYGAELNIAGGH